MTDQNQTEQNVPTTSQPISAAVPAGTTVKDFLIPLSIIIAGIFVGAGLYFGGGGTQNLAQPVTDPTDAVAEVEEVDTTNKVSPVDENDHIKGDRDAAIVIVEYSDFDCPFCSRYHDVMNEIVAENNDVAWVYRHFPLEQLHPQAAAVALASECVAKVAGPTGFWSFTDGYFAARGAGDQTAHATLIGDLVREAGAAGAVYDECFNNQEKAEDIEADLNNAVETGGRGTPWSIIIGPSGKTYPVNGALPKTAVEQLIEVARNEG
tara:strand:- start:2314 stop:3105 length:792 start_codon:yes stop_codon:yes gene_type:complete